MSDSNKGGRIAVLLSGATLLSSIFAPSSLAEEDYLRQGIAAYQQGKYTDAVGYFGAAKGTQSENPLLHYYMGNTLIKLRAPADALREYKLARDLSPGSQMSKLCDAAIASLEAAAAPAQPKVFQTKPAEQPWRMPQVVCYMCTCQMCADVERLVNQLYAQTKNNLIFLFVEKGASDSMSQSLVKKYDFNAHPTVLFINEYGVLTKRFSGFVNTQQLQKEVSIFAESAVPPKPTNKDEQDLADYRRAQMNDLYVLVCQEETRARTERMRIDQDAKQQVAALPRPTRRTAAYANEEYDTQVTKIEEDAQKHRDDVTVAAAKRKMELYLAAQSNIEKEKTRLKHLSEISKKRGQRTPQGR